MTRSPARTRSFTAARWRHAWPLLLLAACQAPQPPATPVAAPVLAKPAAPLPAPVMPTDVNEQGAGYEIGISYPPTLAAHSELIPLLTSHADAIRKGFMTEVAGRDAKDDLAYSLSMQYTLEPVDAQVIAAGMNGDMFTGGAHGAPLIERWLWLRGEHRVLSSNELLETPHAWATLTTWARDQLLARASAAMDAEAASSAIGDEAKDNGSGPSADALAERASGLSDSARWIEQGTADGAKSFALFEPVAGKDGRLAGLRFVFPPYQIGPYSDGPQSLLVPASVLLPLLDPRWRPLFEGGPPPAPPVAPAPANMPAPAARAPTP